MDEPSAREPTRSPERSAADNSPLPPGEAIDVNVGRTLLLGVGLFAWIVAMLSLAIWATAGTSGENAGKFAGTIASAVAFVPPAWLLVRWYRGQSERSAAALRQMHAGSSTRPGGAAGSRDGGPDRLDG